jgi:hypothetical protein
MEKAAQKYFERYAENEHKQACELLKSSSLNFEHLLCVPAFDENFKTLKSFFKELPESPACLLILVVNTPYCEGKKKHIAEKHIGNLDKAIERTGALLREIENNFKTLSRTQHLSLHPLTEKHHLLLINKTGEHAIPYEQGVGLARKVANDCGASLISKGFIKQPVLFNTDADAQLPTDYFKRIKPKQLLPTAWVYPFSHTLSNIHEETDNIENYEKHLESYVKGLKYANSPFAFHTIGSCIAINAESYIKARGFPSRNAGEDFYLLNKLRKLGVVTSLEGEPIKLSGRVSHRVPFGTGPALKQNSNKKLEAYKHTCFDYLKCFLIFWALAFKNKERFKNGKELNEEDLNLVLRHSDFSNEIHKSAVDLAILEKLIKREEKQLKLLETLRKVEQEEIWERQFNQKFDALRTLKLVHHLRDTYFPGHKNYE